jgi:hypothetical protein
MLYLSKLLQSENQNIGEVAKLFTNAYQQMKELRTQFVELNNTAKTLAAKWGTSTKFIQKRASRPKLFFDESRKIFLGLMFLRTVDILSLRNPAARQFCRSTYTITDITIK